MTVTYDVDIPRLESVQYDLAQQIRVDFEKSFSIKGAPVSGCHSNSGSVAVMRSPLHCLLIRLVLNISCMMPVRSWIFLEDGKSMMSLLHHFILEVVRLQLSDYEIMFTKVLRGHGLIR